MGEVPTLESFPADKSLSSRVKSLLLLQANSKALSQILRVMNTLWTNFQGSAGTFTAEEVARLKVSDQVTQ
jgi:hypothetical protein